MNKGLQFVGAMLLCGASAFAGHGEHWGYTGHEGPEHWGELSEKYRMCGAGMNQSPIDITASVEGKLAPIEFDYHSAPVEILNNGHTVQVNVAPGSGIVVEGHRFELKQYHFHTPSENHIEGHAFPLEMHLVHADAEGNLAVVGVMFEAGKANAELSALWEKMPMHEGEHAALAKVAEDVNALLPEAKGYYRFNGSLTTPPCSEGVVWMVLDTPLSISNTQVEHFSHAVHGANNRPVQHTHARMIVH